MCPHQSSHCKTGLELLVAAQGDDEYLAGIPGDLHHKSLLTWQPQFSLAGDSEVVLPGRERTHVSRVKGWWELSCQWFVGCRSALYLKVRAVTREASVWGVLLVMLSSPSSNAVFPGAAAGDVSSATCVHHGVGCCCLSLPGFECPLWFVIFILVNDGGMRHEWFLEAHCRSVTLSLWAEPRGKGSSHHPMRQKA